MSRAPVRVQCPFCEVTIDVGAPLADGGEAEDSDRLTGRSARCEGCDREVEILFYPR